MRKSAAAAATLYRETYDAGHGPSKNNLGLSYRQGVDVKRGDAQPIACFTRAVALQNFGGAVNLGDVHARRRGTKRARAAATEHHGRPYRYFCAGSSVCATPGVRPDQAVRVALLARSFRSQVFCSLSSGPRWLPSTQRTKRSESSQPGTSQNLGVVLA